LAVPGKPARQESSGMLRIERTPRSDLDQALVLVVGGGATGSDVAPGAEALRTYMDRENRDNCTFWWAREESHPLAAAMVINSRGRTAMILHSTTDAGIVAVRALSALLAAAAEEALRGGATLVQALLSPTSLGDIEAFTLAGFSMLADLIYMRLHLRGRFLPAAADPPGIEYRTYGEETRADFASAISASYEDSLDCPLLKGARDIEDIVAGHKASGVFREDLWSLAYCEGQPAGVILVNDASGLAVSRNAAEIVYMGVARPFRGRGLGAALLARAARIASTNRFSSLCLAVDSRNHYAHRLYRRAGFVRTSQRFAYVRLRGTQV
jgi:ribosomal protein S18 acetylase RimI-like enzyme